MAQASTRTVGPAANLSALQALQAGDAAARAQSNAPGGRDYEAQKLRNEAEARRVAQLADPGAVRGGDTTTPQYLAAVAQQQQASPQPAAAAQAQPGFEGGAHDPRMWTHADHPEGFHSSKDYGQIAGYTSVQEGGGWTYNPADYGHENFDPSGSGHAAAPTTAAPAGDAGGGGGTGDVLSPSMSSLTGSGAGAPAAGAAMGALQEPGGSLLRPTLVTRHPAVLSASLAQLGKAY